MTRKKVREHLFKLLFLLDFYPKTELDDQVSTYLSDIGNDYFIPIAKYSTKEKAIRAMEMCARKYEACEVTAFKFPKDSEVEV